MELLDLTKRLLDKTLPKHHQSALTGLSALLLLLIMVQHLFVAPENLPTTVSLPREQPIPGIEESNGHDNPEDSLPAASLAVPISAPPEQRLFLTVKAGDNLSLIFKRAGLGPADVFAIANSSNDAKLLTNLYPGNKLAFEIDNNNKLRSLELFKTPLLSYHFTRTETNSYHFSEITKKPHIEVVFKEALINDSLFLAAQKSEIPAAMAMELASVFGGVIDFILDTRKGDSFSVLYEQKYLDGEFIGNGRILATSFTNQGNTFTALRYENTKGDSNFFNPSGESMRKAFLRNPVDFTRISSGFSLSRKHPILNTIRAHKGTDYTAPRGTPVVATADGKVSFAARNGSFGKLIVIQHGGRFETKYAHLNDYARGIKSGAKVKQGQIIGYVGSTGGATGPHLHYEFLMDGAHRNPRTIHDKLPKVVSIPAAEADRFQQQTRVLLSMLETHGATAHIARNDISTNE